MCPLFQNRIKSKLYKHCLHLFLAMSLCNLIYVADGYAKEQTTQFTQVMFKYLSWEKYWYGEFFGEDCFNKLVGKNTRIAIQHKTDSEIRHVFRCDEKRGQVAEQKTFDAYIANTNYLFHGVWLGNKPIVEISMGSAPPGCTVDDLEPRVTNLIKDSRTIFVDVTVPPVEPVHLPPVEDNLKDHIVLETVRRSMESFINYYYFQPVPFGEPQRKYTSDLLEKIKHNDRIMLARFNKTDPFLLVYYEGDDKVYRLDFPSRELLINENICMQVYSAQPYLGDVSDGVRKKVMNNLLNKVKNNSIELKLKIKATDKSNL